MEMLFDIKKMNDAFYEEAKELFSKYDTNICEKIVSIVAGLYNIEKKELFSHKLCHAVPRWLCWLALRQFTSLSNSEIARSFTFATSDKPFTGSAVTKGITSIRQLIEQDNILKSKWTLVKKFLDESINKYPKDERITIIVPMGMKQKIDIKEAKI